jgi:hypothetical protein
MVTRQCMYGDVEADIPSGIGRCFEPLASAVQPDDRDKYRLGVTPE